MSERHDDPGPAVRYNARLGIALFLLYLITYAAFVLLSAFTPNTMAKPIIGGVNLAVVFGLGLIVLALVLAIVYMLFCKPQPPDRDGGQA